MITYSVIIATDPKDGELGVSLEKAGVPADRQEKVMAELFQDLLERGIQVFSQNLLKHGHINRAVTMSGETARREGEEFKRRAQG